MRRIVLGMALAAGVAVAARADDFPLDEQVVAVSEVATSKQINDVQHGIGKQETKTWKFTVRLKATGMDALPPLAVKLHVVQVKNWAPQMDQFKEESVVKVLEKQDVPATGEPVELGEVDISSMTSDAGSTKWYGGFKYAGYVLEVYQDGKLVDTKVGGGAPVRKAYEAGLKNAAPPRGG